MVTSKRALSYSQAKRCEEAKNPRCRCRCGGTRHGAQRTITFGDLPQVDPHFTLAKPKEVGAGDPAGPSS